MGKKPETADMAFSSVRYLEALELFNGEEFSNLNWVRNVCRVKSLEPDEVFLNPDQDNDALFIILSGRAEVRFRHDKQCSSVYLETGECAGEMSIIDGSRPSATVLACSRCQVMIIDAEVVWLLIERSSVVARNLLHILSKRMRVNNLALVQSQVQRHKSEHDALHDALTGLKNRRWMERAFEKIVKQCTREGAPLALLMIDTDYFKHYNDEHGHLAGDNLLASIAYLIRETVRSSDYTCRYGGDEFVVISPHINPSGAMTIAERICRAIREVIPRTLNASLSVGVSVSIGVACLEPSMSVRQLMDGADAALYRAKAAGRDRVSC